MKNLFAVLLFLFISVNLFSQDKPRIVEVTGTATIEIQPDIMNWDLRIQDDNDNLKSAADNNDESTTKILEHLKNLGIKSEKISTSGIRITKNYSYAEYKTKKYTVTNNIWFSIDDISLYGKIVNYILSFENVYINNTILGSTKEIETRNQARINALNAAKDKAQVMASVYGKEIGEPVTITEEVIYPYYNNTMSNMYTPGTYSETEQLPGFSKGMINVTAKVRVVFTLK